MIELPSDLPHMPLPERTIVKHSHWKAWKDDDGVEWVKYYCRFSQRPAPESFDLSKLDPESYQDKSFVTLVNDDTEDVVSIPFISYSAMAHLSEIALLDEAVKSGVIPYKREGAAPAIIGKVPGRGIRLEPEAC